MSLTFSSSSNTSSLEDFFLRWFPSIQLSCETLSHKKVYNQDLVVAIPHGRKTWAWFCVFDGKPVCILIDIQKRIPQISLSSFSVSLCYGDKGSVFYGTLTDDFLFCVESIPLYQGKRAKTWKENMGWMAHVFEKELGRVALNSGFTVFGVPLMHNSFVSLINLIRQSPLEISHIQFRWMEQSVSDPLWIVPYLGKGREIIKKREGREEREVRGGSEGREVREVKEGREVRGERGGREVREMPIYNKPQTISSTDKKKTNSKVFIIRAELQDDIYSLLDSQTQTFVDYAFIPDYKTSVLLNKHFRKIKENDCLDALEESDDEEEFESHSISKFVDSQKKMSVVCTLHPRFKKWVPISLS
jgi:hypothetical protein